MGKIKRLQRGYAVSYCKKVKDCTALACTDGNVPISYTLFIKHSAQPTKHQQQSSTVCRDRTFSLLRLRSYNKDPFSDWTVSFQEAKHPGTNCVGVYGLSMGHLKQEQLADVNREFSFQVVRR